MFQECSSILAPADFSIVRHRAIWKAFENLSRRKADIDFVTVLAESASEGIDGAFLTSLAAQSANSFNAKSYAEIVKDKSRRRAQLEIASRIAHGAHNGGVPISKIVSDLVNTSDLKKKSENLTAGLSRYYEEITERSQNPKQVWGIATGYMDFDVSTGGLHKKNTLMISGAPGTGKSILASCMILQSALLGTRWAVYSLEMSQEELIRRWVGQLTGLSEDKLSSGMFEQNKWPEITQAIETLENLPIYINDSARMKTTDIQADLCAIEQPVDAVCVDYLELLGDTAESANEATARKSRGFREICKEQNIAGLIIQSMTKEGIGAATGGIQQGGGKKSFVSSQAAMIGVRGPADLAHDADTIFMLVVDPQDETGKTIAALPAKKRHGNGDKRPIRFVWNKNSPKLESAARY
jgi:replicative DNA helicase